MNWELIVSLFAGGGVLYLIVEKLFSRRADKAEAGKSEVERSSETAKLYMEIREIVNSELAPIQAELKEIKDKYCCYREKCEMRIPVKSMLDVDNPELKEFEDEAEEYTEQKIVTRSWKA